MGQGSTPIRLILFDFDGTLVDSQRAIVEAMGTAFAEIGLKRPAAPAVRRIVGLGLEQAVQVLMDDHGRMGREAGLVEAIAERYRQAHLTIRSRPDHLEPLFPGVREVLAGLDHPERFMGIATGKSLAGLFDSLERHGLKHHFATLQTGDRNRSKPDPEMVQRAMDWVGVEPIETVMVGDTTYDMEMAGNAGVEALGVSWGYHQADELSAAGAARVLESAEELLSLVSSRERHGT